MRGGCGRVPDECWRVWSGYSAGAGGLGERGWVTRGVRVDWEGTFGVGGPEGVAG